MIGFISQLVFLVMFSVLWAIFLKAYPIILQNVPQENFWKTIIHIIAGPKATIFDFIIGKVDPFFGITAATPVILSVYLYRWYLGLEWLELVPISRIIVPGIICFGSAAIYASVVYKTIRKQ